MAELSVIVPFYNVEAYMERCLDSIQNQTFSDFIVYCINDGTKDNSRDIAAKFAEKDERFILLDKQNGGLSDARNFAFPYADSEFVVFIDSDDFLELDCFEKSIEKMKKDQLDFIVYDYYQYFEATEKKEVIHIPLLEDQVYCLDADASILVNINNSAWNKMFRLSLFKNHEIVYPVGIRYEDLAILPTLIAYAKRIGSLSTPLYNYIADRSGNITTAVDEKMYDIFKSCQNFIDSYKELDIFSKYQEELKHLAFINIRENMRKCLNMKDDAFVYSFYERSFVFMNDNFDNPMQFKYDIGAGKENTIYTNESKLKSYYRIRKLLKGGK